MPNLKTILFSCGKCEPKYGSRQRREKNLDELVLFLRNWKDQPQTDLNKANEIAERYSDIHFHYSYNTKRDIVLQALMIVDLV